MPRYLALETSSPRLSLALGDGTRVLAAHEGALEWRHAESLFSGLRVLLQKIRWPIESLTGVAVGIGPGSFTGIRIGLAAARTLGQTLRIPVVGVTSLETIAAQAPASFEWLCPRLDGLKGQIYTALYKRSASGLTRVLPEIRVEEALWQKRIRPKIGRHPLWLSHIGTDLPRASTLLAMAQPRLAKAKETAYRSVLPVYIRDASATERLKK